MSAPAWFDWGALIAGVLVGALGTLGAVKLRGKAPPKGDVLRK